MTLLRSVQRSLPFAALGLGTIAPIAAAQLGRVAAVLPATTQRQLFEWTGAVDREKRVVMRGDRVVTNDIGASEPRMERARTMTSMPHSDGRVVVRMLNGRGTVQVVEQPNARNNYTAVFRVTDARAGSDNYRFAAYWEGYNAPVRDDHDWDRGRGNDDWDRGRGNDDWDRGRGPNVGYGRRDVLHWSGNVDDELELVVQNGRVQYRTLRGAQPTGVRAATGNSDLRSNQVGITDRSGRGSVTIVQQPSSRNGYTTVIRVKDPQGGYGHYEFDVVAR